MMESAPYLLLYDADCSFCRWSVTKLLVWDGRKLLQLIPLQHPATERLLHGIHPAARMASWHMVTSDGQVYSAGRVVPVLFRLLPGGWPIAALASLLPGAVEKTYRWVAQNRHRIGRYLRSESCAVERSGAAIRSPEEKIREGHSPSVVQGLMLEKSPKTTLTLRGIFAGYDPTPVLHGVDLEIGPGFHVILGPNGAGKTTLFRVAAGVLAPKEGQVQILGHDPYRVPQVKRQLAYLPHRPALHPTLTVRENLEFWARVLGLARDELQARIEQVLSIVGVLALASKPSGMLSRGQGQRVAVARALLGDPRVLLLDEPTIGLDPAAAHDMRDLLRSLAREERVLIYSTHNLYEASELAEDVILLAAGRVVARGVVEDLRSRFTSRWRVGIRVGGDPRPIFANLGHAAARQGAKWVVEITQNGQVSRIVKALVEAGLEVQEVSEFGSPLEAVYFGFAREENDA